MRASKGKLIIGIWVLTLVVSMISGFCQTVTSETQRCSEQSPGTPTYESIDTSDWNVYRNVERQFDFKYPGELVLLEGNSATYPSGALFPPPFLAGSPIVRVGFPKSKYQNSNLIEASLAVYVYPEKTVSECLKGVYNQQELSELETINGIDFFIERWGEGGMGHRYEVASYRTIHQGACYAVNLVLYWSSMSEEMRTSTFDKTEVLELLINILRTFTFIKSL